MKKLSLIVLVTLFALAMTACEDWVQSVEPQISVAEDEALDTPEEIPFLITGVESRFAFVYTRLALSADLVSDQLIFDTEMPLATFPTYRDANANWGNVGDQTTFSDNTTRNIYTPLGGFRFIADDLLERIARVEGLSDAVNEEATFVGNFYGAAARYFIGFYFVEDPCGADAGIGSGGPECIEQLGGPIDASATIPAREMATDEILPRLAAAEAVATPYQQRVINSFRARMLLFLGEYEDAYTFAQDGMEAGDAPFQSLHSVQSSNEFYFAAGVGRIQAIPDYRFAEYVDEDPAEANRVQVIPAEVNPDRFRQDVYPEQDSPMNFLTWQENELILAELEALHGQGTGGQVSALTRINDVRASHDIDPLIGTVDEDMIFVERDKELFLRSVRMLDQLRFNRWHEEVQGTPGEGLTGDPIGPWRGLPIPNDERNQNPDVG
jgi:starch-binding outer membrane protein, SusD/RagB family